MSPSLHKLLLSLSFLLLPVFFFILWQFFSSPDTLPDTLRSYGKAGESAFTDLQTLPILTLTEEEKAYTLTDTKDGIDISFNNQKDTGSLQTEETPKLSLSLPKDYQDPIEIKLDQERSITLTDQTKESLTPAILTESKEQKEGKHLAYQNDRKTILYTFQKDQATGEKKLKNWTLYQEGNGLEEESYQLENAKVKINEQGDAEVFYYGQQDLQNEQAKGEVDPSLLERAQRTLEKELGEDATRNTPDFIIPKPYFYDKNGERHEAEWKLSESSSRGPSLTDVLSLTFTIDQQLYPIALDPTLAFTAPGQSNTGSVIQGEAGSNFGSSMVAGDFNADGRMDLAVGAQNYASPTGSVYIFYNDGGISASTTTADIIITGESASFAVFGNALGSGDFNADGKADLVIGDNGYSTATGRAYIFYNDGSIPTTAATADVIITGETTNNRFGASFISGDFNADGRTDIAVGAYGYSSSTGRVYIFYNDGSIPTAAGSADVIITGGTTNDYFGSSIVAGDLNTDGKIDLIVGAYGYSTATGRAYIFYNDGSIPTTAATADVIITGASTSDNFGYSFAVGDFNQDGRTDLAVGANLADASLAGSTYLFYNDGSIPTAAGSADVIIVGESNSDSFGYSVISGDFNADGRTDIAVGAKSFSLGGNTGRTYLFYNDGSIPATAATADVIITGEASSQFGYSLASSDFNSDGKTDLAVGAYGYSSSAGRAYIFYSQNGQVNTNQSITGEAGSYFGYTLGSGDFNADGKIDLAVGAQVYSSNTGRAYIFYNDGSIPTTAATADIIITGEATSNGFGSSFASGDFNQDGKTDIVVGADGYSSSTGRAYIFYNDGSIPTTAATADVIITGEASSGFGIPLISGDFNQDGKTDLAVGAQIYSSFAGRTYIFYNDGSIPTTAATADAIITGESGSYFGAALGSGDFNQDGKTDLSAGAYVYSTSTGRAYIFYGGSITTEAATAADVIITGEASSSFGYSFISGDFNSDGKQDLVVGAFGYSSNTGRAYIFYNDGSIPTTAATADIIITGDASSYFGWALTSGDFNADGKIDLAVGARGYSSNTGRVHLFYNDSSIPTTAATADVVITGGATSDYFGYSLLSGDFNADGRTDLAVGARGYSSNAGRAYIYETRENFAWQLQRQADSSGLRTGINTTGQELKVTGEASSYFGKSLVSGDFNADGKTDLAVGANGYSSATGRVYIFHNDGSLTTAASSADVIIVGETTSDSFGTSLASGDFNADGKTDLAVGASDYSSSTGRVYIFHNDGSIPTTAATADVIITGEGEIDNFGLSLASGDFNADGKTDLAVGASWYGTDIGRAYLFYNDGSIPIAAGSADVIISHSDYDNFGSSLIAGDFNADGRIDLAVSAASYSSSTGRTYIFYNDGSIPTTTATADVIITGEASSNYFGDFLTSGDFNADGKTDLAVGAYGYSSNTGRAYLFYNDGSLPTTAASADVIITGESSSQFSFSLTSGDFNADSRQDLAVAAYGYSTNTGRVYIFYNDGSIPTTATTADVIITGETTNNYFGWSLTSGDFNADGKTDLVVGAYGYSTFTGRIYLYTFNDSVITGEATSNYFGLSLASGDFNADGKTDLAVGAFGYSTFTGRAYIFYNDGSIPTTAATADVIITGEATTNYFGISLVSGDFNADSKQDLIVGANAYSSWSGRIYIFYNDGSYPTTAATADVIITGEVGSYFSRAFVLGDFNTDGKQDLAVGAYGYSTNTGRTYIFYNDGSIPTTAATADVIIIGEATNNYFGYTLASGDFNADGKTDLVVGAYGYSTTNGRSYIFYNDGSIPTTAATADVIITGESGSYFGWALALGDFNTDGKIDLAVGGYRYTSYTGRTYIFYNDGSYPTTAATADIIITGEQYDDYFGISLAVGDLNQDGKQDLIVSARHYPAYANTGRTYVFYGGNIVTEVATGADVFLTGETTNNYFSYGMTTGDFNTDGKQDLAVGAYGYSTSTGRVYIFTTEAAVSATPPATANLKGSGNLKGSFQLR